MHRSDKLINDPQIIEQILNESSICRIGFSIDGEAHIVPVNFGYMNNKLYIHSAPEGQKIDFIKKNNRICFEMELDHEIIKDKVACNWTTKYRSVIGYGTISIIHEKSQKINGLNIIMSKYGGPDKNSYSESALSRMILLVIDIDTLTGKQSGE